MPSEDLFLYVARLGDPRIADAEVALATVTWQPDCPHEGDRECGCVTITPDVIPGEAGCGWRACFNAADLDALIGTLRKVRFRAFGESYLDLYRRYGRPEKADLGMVLEAAGHPDADSGWSFARQYPSAEACRAFAATAIAYGHKFVGPVTINGRVYGVILMPPVSTGRYVSR